METMEKKILSSITAAINTSIENSLSKYDSPLIDIIKSVVEENHDKIKSLVREAFHGVFESEDFKNTIKNEMIKKMARVLISKSTGELESAVNKIKSNPEAGAELTLGVSKVIKELLDNK